MEAKELKQLSGNGHETPRLNELFVRQTVFEINLPNPELSFRLCLWSQSVAAINYVLYIQRSYQLFKDFFSPCHGLQ